MVLPKKQGEPITTVTSKYYDSWGNEITKEQWIRNTREKVCLEEMRNAKYYSRM